MPRSGQTAPNTIVLAQPRRFGIDIDTWVAAIRAAENVDFSRRVKLYDLYADILMDPHLTSVINKRKNFALCTPVEFRRKGKPDEKINEQLRSPWFRSLCADVLDASYWGFTMVQFYRQGEWMDYDLIPRKHVDPVRRLVFRHQTDLHGQNWEEYGHLLFVGNPRSLGLLAQAVPYVIYKRNTMADWAQFSEIFGMPIREYTYDANDEDARRRTIEDAFNQGGAQVYVHPNQTALKLVESGSKTGSADLYDRLSERCNAELSKLILGNTLTTEAGDKGTQALGTVHKKVEDLIVQGDRKELLNVLNYDMADIFLDYGIDTSGGEFVFAEPQNTDVNGLMDNAVKMNALGIPLDPDDLYEKTGFKKPKAVPKTLKPEPEDAAAGKLEGKPKRKKGLSDRISGFFAYAPEEDDGALSW